MSYKKVNRGLNERTGGKSGPKWKMQLISKQFISVVNLKQMENNDSHF